MDCCLEVIFRLFEKAATSYEAAENAAKDISHLLHSLGRAEEAVDQIQASQGLWRFRKTHMCLLTQLKAIIGKPVPPISSRVVYIEVPSQYGRITLDLLRRLFPNIQKVWRIILSREGRSCLIEFASHSSARRAVDSRQQGHSPNSSSPTSKSDHGIKCAWVSPLVEIPPICITKGTDLPVVEFAIDESIISPSLDWRRPRPRTDSDCPKDLEGFSAVDLMSVLKWTGAFDDYPALVSQLRL